MPVRAVLLDAFGTVVHAEPGWESRRRDCLAAVHSSWTGSSVPLGAWLAAYEEARNEQHAKVSESLREFDFPERFARSMTLVGAPRNAALAWGPTAHERYHAFQQELIHAYDAPAATLAELKARGFRVGLLSNYGHAGVLREALGRLGLLPHFDQVIVSADVGYLKPHGRIFEAALDALGVRAEETAMVGNDLLCDIVGAKRAGLRAVWTPYPRASPAPTEAAADVVLERLADLPDALAKLD